MLYAKFNLGISSPCLLLLPENAENPSFIVKFNDFEVKVTMLSGKVSKRKDDTDWTKVLGEIELTISREEPDIPPEVIVSSDGRKDFGPQSQYLSKKLPLYKEAALNITNRILCYFQYSLFTPLVRPFPPWDYNLNNPSWLNENREVLKGGNLIVLPPIPGLDGQLGSRKLIPNELPSLQKFIEAPTDPSLAYSLLSDAQSAWFEDNLRRSVLELAICAEVMVKRKFFAKSSPAGAAFDYLEDRSKTPVRVLELLDAVAKEAFSRSYKEKDPDSFKNIDHLFRCRNKIAHRGELYFKDDSGITILADKNLVETWWNSVVNLKEWLDSIP